MSIKEDMKSLYGESDGAIRIGSYRGEAKPTDESIGLIVIWVAT